VAFLAATAAAVIADQATKALTHSRLLNDRGSPVGLPVRWTIVLWAATVSGAAMVLLVASPSLGTVGAVGLGLALGGATSNLADRVVRGAVVDFIALWRWPAFNLADAAMVIGWVLLTGSLL
jgi:signal peptidase II